MTTTTIRQQRQYDNNDNATTTTIRQQQRYDNNNDTTTTTMRDNNDTTATTITWAIMQLLGLLCEHSFYKGAAKSFRVLGTKLKLTKATTATRSSQCFRGAMNGVHCQDLRKTSFFQVFSVFGFATILAVAIFFWIGTRFMVRRHGSISSGDRSESGNICNYNRLSFWQCAFFVLKNVWKWLGCTKELVLRALVTCG